MTTRMAVLAASAVVATVVSGCQQSGAPVERATQPDACAVALAPEPATVAVADIARLQADARTNADSRSALEQLGYRYVARARRTHDAGDYTLAEQTANCLSARYPDAASALLLKGHVLHQMHRFAEAEQIARRLVTTREFVLDYGLLGDVLMDQGRLSEAAAAYQRMIDIKPYYQSYTRAAHLRWLKGDLDGAVELIQLAIQSASPRDPESVAWAYTRLATYELQRGRLDQVDGAIESALTYQPEYAAALLTRGRLLLAKKQPTEAIASLEHAARRNPLPEYRWVLADALRVVGRMEEAERLEQALIADGAQEDPRTLALFLATRQLKVEDAIATAQRELQSRSDVFTLDAVAWALAAGDRLDEASETMARALTAGTEDARLFLHAAVIADRQDRRADADRWAARAAKLSATLLPSELTQLDSVRHRAAGRLD